MSSRLIAVLTFVPAVVSAQEIQIRPKLTAGDEFRVEVTRVRQRTRPPTNVTARTLVAVRVISAAPDGTVLEWTPGETEFDDPRVAQNPMVSAAARSVSGLRIRLALNADGEFTGVANKAEITPKLQAMADTIREQISASIPADQRQKVGAVMRQMLSPAALLSGATTDAQIYLALNGAALARDETRELRIEAPSPVGAGTVPAAFRVRLDAATADSAALTTTTTHDVEAIRSMTAALAQQVGKPIPPEELAKLPPIEMSDDGKYFFDRTVGLMREVQINRRVTAGNEQRLDRWMIRLVSPPKR